MIDEPKDSKRQDDRKSHGGFASYSALVSFFQNKGQLAVYTALLLAASVGNQVYFKRMTSAMPNYGWFLTQLSTFIYVPFFAMLAGTGVVEHAKPGLIRKFAMMGVFDGLSGTLMVLGGVQTSGTMQVLISQAVIPLTMICSVIFLGKHFHVLQSAGAGIIVAGILFAKAFSGDDSAGGVVANSPVFNAIFFLAIVPSALSSVFKEVAFRGFDGDLDVNVLQFWVASFQVCVNFLAMPIYSLSVLGAQQVPLSEMSGLIVGGTRCLFFLEDQVVENCGLPGEKVCDNCSTAWIPVGIYLAFNLLYNVFTMLVIKHGSAALSFLVATLRMPLASLAFSSPMIMGAEATSFGMSDCVSLAIIVLGLCTYRYGGRLLKRKQKQDAAGISVPPGESPVLPPPSPDAFLSPSSPSQDLGEPLVPARSKGTWKLMPIISTAGLPAPQPTFLIVRAKGPAPRSAVRVRHDLYHRLGAASPLQSPQLRHLSPGSPGRRSDPDPEDEEDSDIRLSGLPEAHK